jgi:DNA-directed RNA polymerase subunit RPC12/RpoP
MFSPDELFALFGGESVFPGLFSGEAEQRCPHCGTELTLPVDDPLGSSNYVCCNCQGRFEVDWGAETVRRRTTD